jgi:plastocyanin domain-containing protein
MFTSGLSLSGVDVSSPIAKASAQGTGSTGVAVLEDGVQTVTTKLSSGRYQPITVQKGVPVKWTIKAGENDLNGCNSSIIIPKLDKQVDLVPGDNVIEFTPEESGTIPYSCWMGMIRSKITVVDDIGNIDPVPEGSANGSDNGTGPNTEPSETLSDYKISTDSVAVAEIKDGIQTVSIDIDENGFTPAVVVMQKGIKTEWTLNGKKLNGSNSSLVFPLYNVVAAMKEGENKIALIPEKDFDFSASDYSFFGIVKVVDDIKTADISAIKEEVKNYVPSIPDLSSGGGSGAPSCH